ncbi:hypothetical protein BKA59DRAFT_506487 [Fusarium tricinctum]|uniref:F-box domain-containing protein n=1 Tax=Fusarium tricinctum TaxID=61284 RepID=A0A8K0SB50_9HYPO|nr:hypothetical protein BKA59DRAFT_506487 [Fusarium tricinctum]
MDKLPTEIVTQIMQRMPHSTLYLFQQTCSAFRQISRDNFEEFNREFRSDGPENYCISEANYRQRQIIRDILTRSTQCEPCYSRRETGVLQREMKRLYRPFWCSACRQTHPTLFFSPEERRKQPWEYSQCLGRVGNFTLCSHKSLPAPDLVTLANICEDKEIKIVCKDQSHVPPQLAITNDPFYLTFPHSLIVRATPRLFLKAGGLPSKLHFRVNKNVEFPKLGMQDTLSDKERGTRLQDAYQASSEIQQTCCKHFDPKPFCEGRNTWNCNVCNAQHTLKRLLSDQTLCNRAPSTGDARIILQVEHTWTSTNFLSPAWLFNLEFYKDQDCDARLKRNPLYDERTKHVLWCDTPGCETGLERRWMNMAKVYLKWNAVKGTEEFDWCHRSGAGSGLPTGFWDLHWLSFTYDFFHSVGKYLEKGEQEE